MDKDEILAGYGAWLRRREYSPATIEKYTGALARFFAESAAQAAPGKEAVAAWQDSLAARGYTPATVNAMLAAVNDYQESIGNAAGKAKPLKRQRRVFCDADRELTRASIRCKGKCREILLPAELCRRLQKWCRKRRIHTGPVFLSRAGRALSRVTVWKIMKALCSRARVAWKKVFPHNLRHLFARAFYEVDKNIAKLADLLGHSSIETTRIYIMESGEEHRRLMERMHLLFYKKPPAPLRKKQQKRPLWRQRAAQQAAKKQILFIIYTKIAALRGQSNRNGSVILFPGI